MTRDASSHPPKPARGSLPATPGSSQGMPSREPAASRAMPGKEASPRDASHEASLALPHERDQAVDMTEDKIDPVIDQAQKDLRQGLEDTDKRPAMNTAYQKLKRT